MEGDLRVLHGGSGQPVLLLIHGLGATGDVWNGWRPLLDRRWPGHWLVPDLPGHGGSRPLPRYTFDALAAAIAGRLTAGDRVIVVGHSLGGVLGLTSRVAASRSRSSGSSVWGSRSPGHQTSWPRRPHWRSGRSPGSPTATKRPPATCALPGFPV